MTDEAPDGSLAIVQIAIVVKDVRKTIELYYKTGPWTVFEFGPPVLHDTVMRGVPIAFTVHLAVASVGPIEVEVLQPVAGPSIYQEWLDRHGEGLHHIACKKVGSNAEAISTQFSGLGVPDLMTGILGQNSRFIYLDSEPIFKFILEFGGGGDSVLTPAYIYPAPD